MQVIGNDVLGIAFLLIAAALVLLMFRVWKYPYDKAAGKNTAPPALKWTHRALGYVYVAIYVYLMLDMVPRLWTYQVELPARTVAHLVLGISIGGILLIKLSIVRFFKHMEATLVPGLGVGLFLCTLLLVGLALPVQLRESFLRDSALMGETFNQARIDRVREQLPMTGLEDDELLSRLATTDGLLAGRSVLVEKCVQCHDLRTVLARPRTPDAWRQTVKRMADRSATALAPISDDEQWEVTAYLVAISPTLQQTLQQKRKLDDTNAMAQLAAMTSTAKLMDEEMSLSASELEQARGTFETLCSQCHPAEQVEWLPPASKEQAIELVQRMVRNGLVASDQELAAVIAYINATYVAEPSASSSETSAASATATQTSAASTTLLQLNPAGGDLRFEQDNLTASSGERVTLVFNNTSGLEHNFVLLNSEEVSDDVVTASYGAAGNGFVPGHDEIIASIPALSPGSTGEVSFDVPAPGKYRFVCLYPGHNFTMKGTLNATE